MKSWKERVEENNGFVFGVSCCGVILPTSLKSETTCPTCGYLSSVDKVLAAHGLTRADFPAGFALCTESTEDSQARGTPG